MLQAATNSYVLPYSGGRSAPHHGYSVHALTRKRFLENTSALAVTIGFVLPVLNGVNRQLDKHVAAGTDVSVEELLHIFAASGKVAAVQYADRLARVACQTAVACMIIERKNSYGSSAVYMWDLYPRLHQRYVSAILQWLHIPVFVSSLLGPQPTPVDVAFLQTPVSGVCAFEDSLRRDAISLCGDILVDTARIALQSGVEGRGEAVAHQVVLRVMVTLTGAVGAGVGRATAGEKGEYWGSIAGVLVGPAVALPVWKAMRKLLLLRTHRASRSADPARARRHRRTASEDAKVAA